MNGPGDEVNADLSPSQIHRKVTSLTKESMLSPRNLGERASGASPGVRELARVLRKTLGTSQT